MNREATPIAYYFPNPGGSFAFYYCLACTNEMSDDISVALKPAYHLDERRECWQCGKALWPHSITPIAYPPSDFQELLPKLLRTPLLVAGVTLIVVGLMFLGCILTP